MLRRSRRKARQRRRGQQSAAYRNGYPPAITAFADLHRPGQPLFLPNAWDHASAAALAQEGFEAVGTTSLGVAAAVGERDATGVTAANTLALARLLAPLPIHVTVDAERGFGDTPEEVAEFATQLAELGIAGLNLEDQMAEPAEHAARISAVKRAAPDLFVNARTDVFWQREGTAEEALARISAYVDAGADGVFAPGTTDEATIAHLAEHAGAPLNVLFCLTLPRLAELGVARVSTGSALFRVAIGAVTAAATAIRDGGTLPPAPSYPDVDALADAGR